MVFDDGVNCKDIMQGILGDCYLLSAMSVTAHERPEMITRIFHPDSRTFQVETGQYVVMLYKYRKPVIVVIDDFFPVDNMKTYPYVQIGVAPDGIKEVWPMIIEKAYAKLGGGFPAIEGGLVADALQTLTNGVPYTFEFSEDSTKKMIESGELWTKMVQWSAKEFLMGAGSKSGSDKEVSDLGIVQGHAYSALDFFELEGTKLVQLRNPWGDATEWKGAWGDNSPEWTEARKNAIYAFQESQGYERDIIGKGDGIFWMAYDDFLKNFD